MSFARNVMRTYVRGSTKETICSNQQFMYRSSCPTGCIIDIHTSSEFFLPFGICFSSDRGSFLVLSAPWHAGRSPRYRTQVWALAEVRGTCSGGFQVPSPLEERFRARRAIQAPTNPRTALKECPITHVMFGILNVINVTRHYLVMETFSPTPTCQICDHF